MVASYAEVVASYAKWLLGTQKWLLGAQKWLVRCRLIIKIMSTDTDISIPLQIGMPLQKFLSVKVQGIVATGTRYRD